MTDEDKDDVVARLVEARDAFYRHVNFKEDWTMYPLDLDNIDCRWCIVNNEIRWQDKKAAKTNDYYSAEIFRHRFYPNGSIFEGKEYTMIFGEPHVDGMIWAYVFRNRLRENLIDSPAE